MANGRFARRQMRFLKDIHKYIPGFRQLSSRSMIIAGTYYAVAVAALCRYWYWGLALLAVPFFVFYLIDLRMKKGRLLQLAVAIAAGVAVLLGTAGALSSGSLQAATPAASASAVQSAAAARPVPTESPGPAVSARPSAPAAAGQAEYAYVAAKAGKVFHLPLCASARRIKPENLIGYPTREEAVAAGLTPCKKCKP
jgi:hypothetical protein